MSEDAITELLETSEPATTEAATPLKVLAVGGWGSRMSAGFVVRTGVRESSDGIPVLTTALGVKGATVMSEQDWLALT